MTGDGTNSYLLHGGEGSVLIDPGPDLEMHRDAILRLQQDAPIQAILVTHAHLDHSALAPKISADCGVPIYGFGSVAAGRSQIMQNLADAGLKDGGEGLDHSFSPDVFLIDGQTLAFESLQIRVIHTPGHLSGHLCFAFGKTLFSGDHVMGWSTTLVSPPDGDMGAYMASLSNLSSETWQQFLPGHGNAVNTPAARIAELIAHRKSREASIVAALKIGPQTPAKLASLIYNQTPQTLLPAAARNILAHLIDLHARNIVAPRGQLTADAEFRLI